MNNTPVSPTSEAASSDTVPAFVCDSEEWMRSACNGERSFKEHEGKQFCVLHYPGKDKIEACRAALKRKLNAKNFDFQGVWFPEGISFENVGFSAVANFDSATFSAEANFKKAIFSAVANFESATFNANANFWKTIFSADANFDSATFNKEAYFRKAIFSADVNFEDATFKAKANFRRVTFKSYVSFARWSVEEVFVEQAWLSFQHTHIEKPERVSFHAIYLKPHWFINAECRKFEFIDCRWNYDLKQELEGASKAGINAPHRLLAIAFRQLADNAEANHRYHEASNFRYNAFDARRVETYRGFAFWRLDWWYWLASGYGERLLQAFLVFLGIFILFAVLFTQAGFEQSGKGTTSGTLLPAAIQPDTVGKPLDLRDAFIYSLSVIILQKPEPKPLSRAAKLLVNLETILGPAQAALLALAVRRRFMR